VLDLSIKMIKNKYAKKMGEKKKKKKRCDTSGVLGGSTPPRISYIDALMLTDMGQNIHYTQCNSAQACATLVSACLQNVPVSQACANMTSSSIFKVCAGLRKSGVGKFTKCHCLRRPAQTLHLTTSAKCAQPCVNMYTCCVCICVHIAENLC
jgi:hypothetical protein